MYASYLLLRKYTCFTDTNITHFREKTKKTHRE